MTTTTTKTTATWGDLKSATGKRRYTFVDAPVSGLRFRVRSLFERELSDHQAATVAARGEVEYHKRLRTANRRFIALCLVDDEGNPIVPLKELGSMCEMDGADTTHLYSECAAHVGISTQDLDALVGEAEKNLEETMPSDSPTNSPTPLESST